MREAFEGATRRLALTGTPFRSDDNPIPFVTYEPEFGGGQLQLQDWDSGLRSWLAHNGLEIQDTLVLDEQKASFLAPIARESGGHGVQAGHPLEVQLTAPIEPVGSTRGHAVHRRGYPYAGQV